MTQQSLFDTGETRKQDGIKSVLNHVDLITGDWSTRAINAIIHVSRQRKEFTAEHVRGLIEEPPHHNAWGAAFSTAASKGHIVRVGYVKAQHSAAHGRPISLWKAV